MKTTFLLIAALCMLGVGLRTFAQSAPPAQAPARAARPEPVRPPLLFREEWKEPPLNGLGHATPELEKLEDESRRITQNAVTNQNLELHLYGPAAREVGVYRHEGRVDVWTGMAASPVAVTLRDKDGYIDLTGLARLRWMTRTQGLQVIHPVIKLADGTMLAGSHSDSTEGEFLVSEIAFNIQHWFRLDPEKVVTTTELTNPDLSKVDEIGFVDLMPSAGHFGTGAYANVAWIELYAKTRPR